MDSCWAACLGDCNDKLSREHLVSSSLFVGDTVLVQGFPWCKDKPIEIGIANLTARILCSKHNNNLSAADDAGAKAFGTLREVERIDGERKRMPPRLWNVVRHKIDGRALERWCLKTLINICCDREHPIGTDSNVPGRPSARLVRIAYGRESFENRAGLYFVVRVGMVVNPVDSVGFAPLIKHAARVEGGLFRFRDYMMLLSLEAAGPPLR